MEVEYVVTEGKKGPEASQVKFLGTPMPEQHSRERNAQSSSGSGGEFYPMKLSESTKTALQKPENLHPLLLLDKFARYPKYPPAFDQQQQRDHLLRVVRCKGDEAILKTALQRRESLAQSRHSIALAAKTSGPMTLHLSRAGALENAGICLHPIYGFAYLPGSGLKGMAHAFACEIWLPQQPNKQAAWNDICRVFGSADAPWLKDLAKRANALCGLNGADTLKAPKDAAAGSVVVHDGLPLTWPKLTVDIVNNHHPEYYQGTGEANPPGDWEEPNPVSFLAISPQTEFTFLIQTRHADGNPSAAKSDVKLAAQWLTGALENFGAGAKTAAGYGRFEMAPSQESASTELVKTAREVWTGAIGSGNGKLGKPLRAQFETVLELATPAFFAGSMQGKDDCDLRPATLRGLLRWWWRTMHVGYMSVSKLRELEAAIWGDTKSGGALSIAIARVSVPLPEEFNFKQVKDGKLKAQPTSSFRDRHGIGSTAQPIAGMYYMSFGMDDNKKVDGREIRISRHFLSPPAKWNLRFVARPVGDLTAVSVLEEAQRALWLLVRFGGIGAKSRKGFGCLTQSATARLNWKSVNEVCEAADRMREVMGLHSSQQASVPVSPSLSHTLPEVEFSLSKGSFWAAIEKLGRKYKEIVSSFVQKRDRAALGLPRGKLNSNRPRASRHASPLLFHVEPDNAGGFTGRALAFPGPHPVDVTTSTHVLKDALKQLYDAFGAPAAPSRVEIVMPQTVRPKEDEAVGTVVEKPAKRKAIVQIDGGERVVVTKEVSSFSPGQRVRIKRLPTDEWQCIGLA